MADTTLRSATISVLVDNESGVLARVIGLFSGRGYNIDSLTVAPVESEGGRSRINIVTSGTEMVIEQIKAQLDRLVPVHRVADLTREGRRQVPGLHERVVARTPAGRWGTPDDLAGIAVFLASAASDFVTGVAIPVDEIVTMVSTSAASRRPARPRPRTWATEAGRSSSAT